MVIKDRILIDKDSFLVAPGGWKAGGIWGVHICLWKKSYCRRDWLYGGKPEPIKVNLHLGKRGYTFPRP